MVPSLGAMSLEALLPVTLPLETTEEQGHEEKSLKISASDCKFFSKDNFFQILSEIIAPADLSNVS